MLLRRLVLRAGLAHESCVVTGRQRWRRSCFAKYVKLRVYWSFDLFNPLKKVKWSCFAKFFFQNSFNSIEKPLRQKSWNRSRFRRNRSFAKHVLNVEHLSQSMVTDVGCTSRPLHSTLLSKETHVPWISPYQWSVASNPSVSIGCPHSTCWVLSHESFTLSPSLLT